MAKTKRSTPPAPASPSKIPQEVYDPHRDLLFEATLKNSLKTISPWFGASGFRSFPFRNRCQSVDRGPRLGETFLLNTRLQRHDRENSVSVQNYFTDTALALLSLNTLETTIAADEVPLPESSNLALALKHCLERRRSHRVFTGDVISVAHLAALVRAAQGITGFSQAPFYSNRPGSGLPVALRAAPSPGGLYGIELLIAVRNVRGLRPGLYAYQPRRDQLNLLKEDRSTGVLASIRRAYVDPEDVVTHSRTNATFFLVGRPAKVTLKYGDRGIRYLFVEAGEITENVHLAATALGLGTVESVGFFDEELNAALDLDGGSRTILHSVLVGVPGAI
jgi:SagB-type dehydrogenase family enzyme